MMKTTGFKSQTDHGLNSRSEGSQYLAMKSNVQNAKKAAAGSGHGIERVPDGSRVELVTSPNGKDWDQINGSFIVEHAYPDGQANLRAQLKTFNGENSRTTYTADIKSPFDTRAIVERQVPGQDKPYSFLSENPKLSHAIVNKAANHIEKTRQTAG